MIFQQNQIIRATEAVNTQTWSALSVCFLAFSGGSSENRWLCICKNGSLPTIAPGNNETSCFVGCNCSSGTFLSRSPCAITEINFNQFSLYRFPKIVTKAVVLKSITIAYICLRCDLSNKAAIKGFKQHQQILQHLW